MKKGKKLTIKDAIHLMKPNKLIDIIGRGVEINNNIYSNKNSLKILMNTLSDGKYTKFNLNMFKYLINAGAIPINENIYDNTLSRALYIAQLYITFTKNINASDLMIEFITYLISIGAKPCNSQNNTNSLSIAIKTKNENIINLVVDSGAKPNNMQFDVNTLTESVKTKVLDVVKLAIKLGARPDNTETKYNTLSHAVLINNIDIIKEIIFAGGIPSNPSNQDQYNFYGSSTYSAFLRIFNIEIFNLIMCTGFQMPANFYNYSAPRMIDYWLLQRNKIVDRDIIQTLEKRNPDIIKLKEEIKANIKKLTKERLSIYIQKLNLVNIVLQLPVCCTDIVVEYYVNPMIFIDMNLLN